MTISDPLWPLFDRFPKLAALERVPLRRAITPIERFDDRLWIKRDDLTADIIGGNKVRSLEFLLGGIGVGDEIITAGSRGSTAALAAAIHASTLGARTIVGTWPQEMNDVAERVASRLVAESRVKAFPGVPIVIPWLIWHTLRGRRVIPPGGTAPLGMLGHVNAALELAQQVRDGVMPAPRQVVVPLGTGGTVAGLALGFSLAGMQTTVVAARVVPRAIGRLSRVRRLMRATRRLIEKVAGHQLEVTPEVDVRVVESVYGGAYARPLAGADQVARRLPPGIKVDPTYAAKAFVAAVDAAAAGDTLFWLTFDSRWITSGK